MMAYRRLLLPTNLSEVAEHAALFARDLAEEYGATLYVLHVGRWLITPGWLPEPGLTTLALPPDAADLKVELDAFVRRTLGGIRVPVVAEVRTGPPVRVIAEYARQMAIDLIVLGTGAHGLLPRLLSGSVSEAVLERVGCAVLMVPPTANLPNHPGPKPAEIVATGPGSAWF